jgi:hypothetical protein
MESILRIVSFCTASLILLIGLFLVTGTMIPAAIPERFRVLMGSLMIFYSGYRLWMLWLKRPKPLDNDDTDPT